MTDDGQALQQTRNEILLGTWIFKNGRRSDPPANKELEKHGGIVTKWKKGQCQVTKLGVQC